MKKLLITVGGTGGHVYPALAAAQQLDSLEILFAGGKLKSNPYFDQRFPSVEFASATFPGKNPIKSGLTILKGFQESQKVIKSFKPDLILGFGSFYTFPMLLAAKWTKTPFILHEANREPGKVNRLMGRYAEVTGIHFPDTALKGKTCEVGMPVRFNKSSKEEACRYYGLDPNRLTLLVFGGSQGALAINTLFAQAVEHLHEEIQIIHLTGKMQIPYKRKSIFKPFEENMAMAWQAADLMISRAGASTIAEQMEFEVPGILIPYPFANQHQDKNADFMSHTVGGAVTYRQEELTGEKLAHCIHHLEEVLEEKKANIAAYKKNKKTQSLSDLILSNL